MPDAVERIMNLALAFAHARSPLTAEQVRDEVEGYGSDQDPATFARMFERDKEDLRRSGFVIDFDSERQVYSLNRTATFAAPIELSAEETAVLRVAGAAILSDVSFPFPNDLRLALAKIATEVDYEAAPTPTRLADEDPEAQGVTAAVIADAAERRKVVEFGYTNVHGVSKHHVVEPFGLFLNDGRWYLVGRDAALDEVRTYTVARIADLKVNTTAPKTPDFKSPEDFDVAGFIRLPFQYGPPSAEIAAVVRFSPAVAWRAPSLTRSRGTLETHGDSILWRVNTRSTTGLLRWIIENGPGITVEGPPELLAELQAGLAETETLHG